ncbi:hypothetical protein DW974_20025 [Lachnospiraceae bacterium AM48-27BH]|nr:hypothetical protein DW974_20025 [Lachnospiraceae bacterium AM48-27BH]
MYPLDNGSFGYTWKEEWILPYESLWGIIEKFKYLNMLDSIKTKGLEVKPSQCWDILEEREYYIYKYQTIFDSANLSKFFHIHPSSHFEAATKFIWNNQKEYIDDHIRICPKCIANGYHSYIHQFAWEDKCFIHPRENLIRTKTKYCLQIFKQPPFSEDEDIKKYLEPSIDVLNNLLLNKYPILSKNRWGEHVEYIGFIYHKSFFSEKASLKLKQCLQRCTKGT